jgi:hypothetical protein
VAVLSPAPPAAVPATCPAAAFELLALGGDLLFNLGLGIALLHHSIFELEELRLELVVKRRIGRASNQGKGKRARRGGAGRRARKVMIEALASGLSTQKHTKFS